MVGFGSSKKVLEYYANNVNRYIREYPGKVVKIEESKDGQVYEEIMTLRSYRAQTGERRASSKRKIKTIPFRDMEIGGTRMPVIYRLIPDNIEDAKDNSLLERRLMGEHILAGLRTVKIG